jgi:hypothetical protein
MRGLRFRQFMRASAEDEGFPQSSHSNHGPPEKAKVAAEGTCRGKNTATLQRRGHSKNLTRKSAILAGAGVETL